MSMDLSDGRINDLHAIGLGDGTGVESRGGGTSD